MRSIGLIGLAALALSGCQSSRTGSCADPFTPISQIQGFNFDSPLIGQSVVTEGIVTANYRDRDGVIEGSFIQSETGDGRPNSSEALFGVDIAEKPGTLVRVAGTVVELDRRLTTINVEALTACGAANLPAPEAIVLPLKGRHIESLEAMRVELSGTLRFSDVTRVGSDGEAVVAAGERLFWPTEVAEPGYIAEQVRTANLRRSVTLDDLSGQRYQGQISWWPDSANGLPAIGQTATGLTGIMDDRRGYRLQLTQTVKSSTKPRKVPPAPTARGNLRVVGFNVLNLFNGDGDGGDFPTSRGARSRSEYARQLAKLVAALKTLNADVIALSELENDGNGPNSAVADLQRALSAASGREYQISRTPSGALGDDEIAVGILYASDTIEETRPADTLTRGPFSYLNRPALAQTLRHLESGQTFTTIALHLKSKGCGNAEGPNADKRDGQGCWNDSRTQAVTELTAWIEAAPHLNPRSTLLIGDFNAYSREDPVQFLADNGYRSLVARRNPQYSYIFRGAAGSLDQAMAGRTLSSQLRGAGYWHINADYPAWLDYHEGDKPAELYQPDPLRSSDHDPIVVDFQF
ncbi:MAG: ExeM/NucH family extracellular endonuclease [Lysobacterales bacterium]